jgi:cholesterol oxidase
MYGEVVRHDQLTKETHDLLYHLFDRANVTTFVHLSRMIAKGHIVDKHGRDTYLTPERTKRIDVPITLLQGAGNRLFRPRGGQRTIDWLHEHGGYGPDKNTEMFTLRTVPRLGHLDCFIGKNAQTAVYPIISAALARPGAGTGVGTPGAGGVGQPVFDTST